MENEYPFYPKLCLRYDFKYIYQSKASSPCGIGIDQHQITHVFLTHSDFDHAGGLSLFENAEIYLSRDEEQMITKKKYTLGSMSYLMNDSLLFVGDNLGF